jgi:hypothetical protein
LPGCCDGDDGVPEEEFAFLLAPRWSDSNSVCYNNNDNKRIIITKKKKKPLTFIPPFFQTFAGEPAPPSTQLFSLLFISNFRPFRSGGENPEMTCFTEGEPFTDGKMEMREGEAPAYNSSRNANNNNSNDKKNKQLL